MSIEGERGGMVDLLGRLAAELGLAREPLAIYRALRAFLVEILPVSGLIISSYDPLTDLRTCVFASSEDGEEDVSALPPLPNTGSPHSRAVATGEVVVSSTLKQDTDALPHVALGSESDPTPPESCIAVPMLVSGRVIGGFEVQSTHPGVYGAEHVAILQLAGNLAAIATENLRLLDQERRMRREAEDARSRFEHLIEGVNAVIWESSEGTIHYLSPNVADVLGYPQRRWLEEPGMAASVIHPEDREQHDEAYRRFRSTRRGGEVEYRAFRADGAVLHLRDIVTVVDDGAGRPLIRGLLLDETEEWRRREALRETEEQLRHAMRMEAVGRLAGGIAHDFNNLLTVIQGNADLLAADATGAPPVEIAEIRTAAARAAELTRQLLAFSRKQVMEVAPVQLNDVIREGERMLRRVLRADVQLELRLSEPLPEVGVDAAQLQQVVMNLVVNASDALPDGGHIRISTHDVWVGREVAGLAPGRYVCLEVRDDGEGMSPETLDRAFEPFFTTKEVGRGTGLGLPSVLGLAAQSGGAATLDSSPGSGTVCNVYLPPVFAADAPAVAPPATGAGEHARLHGTVLVVEDEAGVRDVTVRMLRRAGMRVLEAAGGGDAIRLAEQYPADIDVLLTDVVMPGMNGVRVATQILAERPGMKVILMSGYAGNEIPDEADLAGWATFLPKPFTPVQLVQAVARRLHPTAAD